MAKTCINLPFLFNSLPYGFSQIALSKPGKLVFVSGQVAWDEQERIVGGDDLAAQARQAFRNLQMALEATGGSLEDVVMLRLYIVGLTPEMGNAVGPVLREFFGTETPPASSWIGVTALSRKEFRIEVEAQAVVEDWDDADKPRFVTG